MFDQNDLPSVRWWVRIEGETVGDSTEIKQRVHDQIADAAAALPGARVLRVTAENHYPSEGA